MLNKLTLVRLKTDQDVYAFLDDQLVYLRNKSLLQETLVICHVNRFEDLTSFLKANFPKGPICKKVGDISSLKGIKEKRYCFVLFEASKVKNFKLFLNKFEETHFKHLHIISLDNKIFQYDCFGNYLIERIGFDEPVTLIQNDRPF